MKFIVEMAFPWNSSFCLIVLLTVFKIICAGFMRNKYVAEVENVMPCEGNENFESPLQDLKFSKVNRTHSFLSYHINLLHPLDENVGGSLSTERWTNGRWVSTPLLPFHKNVCSYFKTALGTGWTDFMESIGAEHPNKCPIPAGNYTTARYFSTMDLLSYYWSGRAQFTMSAKRMDNNKMVFCHHTITNIREIV